MELLAGTSGYSYKPWKGPFYPEDLRDDGMLAWYAGRLPTVEINNTFYQFPKKQLLEAWAAKVPPGFRFVIKAPRRITHIRRLKNVEDDTRFLLSTLEVLGERLGAILFQLPPNLQKDLPRLEAFLELLPQGTPAALEFRHASWLDAEVRDRIVARGGALCAADKEDGLGDQAFALACAGSWGYMRMRGENYEPQDLAAWAERIRSTGWQRAFVFFKHEDGAKAPGWAARLLSFMS
jgi:uncharacterized protein YecE (DUF72 family)